MTNEFINLLYPKKRPGLYGNEKSVTFHPIQHAAQIKIIRTAHKALQKREPVTGKE